MNPNFLPARGVVADLMRRHDWDSTPLGRPSTWPQALQTVVGLLLHSTAPMYVAWGEQLALIYNDAYLDILGDKHPAALGRPFRQAWSEVWPFVEQSVRGVMAGEPQRGEDVLVTVRRHGYDEQAYFSYSYTPLYEGSRVAGYFCSISETTARVLAASHRDHDFARLQQWFAQAPNLLAVLDGPEHVIAVANAAFHELAGRRALIGMPAREALPGLESQGYLELLDQVYRTGVPFLGQSMPARLRRPSGTAERLFDFIYQPIRDPEGRVSGIFISGMDVTERAQSLTSLRTQEHQLRTAQEGMQLAMAIADAGTWDWDIVHDRLHWSRSHFELLGYEPAPDGLADMGMLHNAVALEDLPQLEAEWNRAMRERDVFRSEHRLRRADGQFIWVSAAGRFFYDASGEATRFTGVFFDITARKQAEQALRDADRRKDEFLATLAHELRNPMAPLRNGLAILRAPGLQDPTRERMLGLMERQVQHLVRLVDDLLEVSRITRGRIELRRESVDLRAVVRACIEGTQPQFAASQHEVRADLPAQPVLVDADPTRIEQVLDNLLNNACKYTPDGGRVRVSLRTEAGEAVLAVEDNGTGIPADMLERVFELFTQVDRTLGRSRGGLGIGLALVQQLVQMHGGSVRAESDGIGAGARFTMRLPLLESAQAAPPAPAAAVGCPAAGALRILVVDDNQDAADSLSMVLASSGHEVRTAYGGEPALREVAAFDPQWVLLDIGMPGMDGHQVARKLRAMVTNGPRPKIVAVTGWGQEGDRRLTDAAGFDAHLVKPVAPEVILRLLAG